MEDRQLKYKIFEKQVLESLEIVRGSTGIGGYHLVSFLLWLKAEDIIREFDEHGRSIKDYLILEIKDYRGDHKDLVEDLIDEFEITINSIEDRKLSYLLQFLNSIDTLELKKIFPQIFESLVYRIARSEGRIGAENLMPLELCRFVCKLFDTKNKWIYNPFAGLASIGVYMDEDSAYYGEEINSKTAALAELRLLVHKKNKRALFLRNDSIEHWDKLNAPIDLVISNPPFGLKIKKDIEGGGNIRSAEHFIIHKGLESITPEGKILSLVSLSFLFKQGPEHELRKYLIEMDLLEMVISFPGGLMSNTGVSVCLVVINKSKQKKGFVRFVNADRFVQSVSAREKKLDDESLNSIIWTDSESEFIKIVANEIVRSNDYNFEVNRYFVKELSGTELAAFVFPVRSSRLNVHKGKFVRIRDLKTNPLGYKLEVNELSEDELPRNAQQINQSVLLLALRWSSLKPTFFEYTGEPVYITSDILALEVNTSRINLDYLIGELHAEYVEQQVKSIRSSSTIPLIRQVDLVKIKLDVPSMEQQLAKVRGYKAAVFEKRKNELEYFQRIHGLESELYEQNAFLRHTLAGPATNLKGSIESLKTIINEIVTPQFPEIKELKISASHTLNLNNYLEILEKNIFKIVETIRKTTEVQERIIDKNLYPVDILSFLQKFVEEQKDIHKNEYSIVLQIDNEIFIDDNGNEIKLFVNGNEDLLADLLNNFIENAEKHAFPGHSKNRIEFFITANADDSETKNTEIVLLISNTGKVPGDDFDLDIFCKKGGRIGKYAGEGYGGFMICEIIKYMNGKLDYIDEQGSEGLPETELATSFEIIFPIIQGETDENI
jgi:type I restriction enzyme M protein